jgi:hypothetical protein
MKVIDYFTSSIMALTKYAKYETLNEGSYMWFARERGGLAEGSRPPETTKILLRR